MMRERLSDKRISEVSTKFNNTFRRWATAREIFEVIYVDDLQDVQNDDFANIGINQILDRNFFTEPKGTTFYDHSGIGSGYGKNMALTEMKYIYNIMADREDVIGLNREAMTDYLCKFINGNSDTEGLAILMSPVNMTTFWGNNEFTHINRKSLWGTINNIPMYWTPEVPKDMFYIFKKNIGKIIVKTDAYIDISEISESDYDSIIEQIPTVTKDKLRNRIRVKAIEVIKFRTREGTRTARAHMRTDVANPWSMGEDDWKYWDQMQPLFEGLLEDIKRKGYLKSSGDLPSKFTNLMVTTDKMGASYNMLQSIFDEKGRSTNFVKHNKYFNVTAEGLVYLLVSQSISNVLNNAEMLRNTFLEIIKTNGRFTDKMGLGALLRELEELSPNFGGKVREEVDTDIRNALAHRTYWVDGRDVIYCTDMSLENEKRIDLVGLWMEGKNLNILYQNLIKLIADKSQKGFFKTVRMNG